MTQRACDSGCNGCVTDLKSTSPHFVELFTFVTSAKRPQLSCLDRLRKEEEKRQAEEERLRREEEEKRLAEEWKREEEEQARKAEEDRKQAEVEELQKQAELQKEVCTRSTQTLR